MTKHGLQMRIEDFSQAEPVVVADKCVSHPTGQIINNNNFVFNIFELSQT